MNESYLTVALIVLIVLILVHMVIYYIALTMNNKHLLRHPEYKSYVWGYFTGVVTIVWGIVLFIVCLSLLFLNVDIGPINIALFYLGFLIFYTALGYFVCSKEKWAFIILTILWGNPIIWVTNYFYIKRRPYLSKNYTQEQLKVRKDEELIENEKFNNEAAELKEQEKLDKVKQSDDTKDHIVNLEQARSLLIDKKITTSEYIKKAEELKEQEKPAKVKQSNESTDYIGELEKAKKLRDDGDINIDDYEILKQDIMSKIQSK